MQKFDKVSLKMLRTKLDKVLSQFGEEHGITFNVGNMTFTEYKASIKLEALLKTASGEVFDQRAEDYKTFAPMYGIKSPLHTEFKIGLDTFKIAGFDRKKHKLPIIVTGRAGKSYKISIDDLKMRLGETKAA